MILQALVTWLEIRHQRKTRKYLDSTRTDAAYKREKTMAEYFRLLEDNEPEKARAYLKTHVLDA